MEVFVIYLIKSSALLFLFWMTYHLFLRKETLFNENRWYLLSGVVLSLLLPLLKIKQTVLVEFGTVHNTTTAIQQNSNGLDSAGNFMDWTLVLTILYLAGCTTIAIKLLLQLKSVKDLTKNARTWHEDDLLHVQTQNKIAPFSFFKALFYNPDQFDQKELEAILSHEKVHAKDWHSLDVLLGEFLKILLWWNPFIWIYQKTIKQNLEFLADAKAINSFNNKSYQFLMLRQATGHQFAITNSFNNSLTRRTVLGRLRPDGLIKKRIVMLNKNRSKQINVLKSLLVLPLLAIFLVSFNTEKVYQLQGEETIPKTTLDKSIELIINKDTSNEELENMKKDLAKDGIDFSYTAVRNEDNEIIDISLQVSGENSKGETFSGNYHTNSDAPIKPLTVHYDDTANSISFGNTKHKRIKLHTDKGHTSVWHTDSEMEKEEDVIIIEKSGKKKIYINGDEFDEDELHEMEFGIEVIEEEKDGSAKVYIYSDEDKDRNSKKHIKTKKWKSKKGEDVIIIKDTDNDADIEVISDDEGFFFIDVDGDGDPLYIVDGKETKAKDVKRLSPKEIETINVYKGERAKEKYGKKAKDGVVEITTKKD